MKNFDIRNATNDDYSTIEKIWYEGLQLTFGSGINVTDSIKNNFKNNYVTQKFPFGFWVAEFEKKVIGWVSILPAFSHPLKSECNGEVSTYVDKEYSHNGIGTLLMKDVFEKINNTKIENVYGFALPINLKSIKMCENAGMRICGETSTKIILVKEFL